MVKILKVLSPLAKKHCSSGTEATKEQRIEMIFLRVLGVLARKTLHAGVQKPQRKLKLFFYRFLGH
jgi:hypothetical protein